MPLDRPFVLGELGHVGVAVVDGLEVVGRRVQQVARGHLGVRRAGVEQRGARRQVLQRGDQPVEVDGLAGLGGQAAGHPHQEVLGRLDGPPGLGVAEQVAVVDGAQAGELEEVGAVVVDGLVEHAGVGLHEVGGRVADEAQQAARGDGLGEAADALVADLLLGVGGEQAGAEPGVAGFLADQRGGGADRQLVEFDGAGAVAEPADRAGGDAHAVHAVEAVAAALHAPHDLGDVDGLEAAVALAHPHRGVDRPGLGRAGIGRHPGGAAVGCRIRRRVGALLA